MKTKDEVLRIFLKWKAMIEIQIGRKIKCLRTDNGGEYKNDLYHKICEDDGILRHFTVRNTPQQNGVAERINRALLEKVQYKVTVEDVKQTNGASKQVEFEGKLIFPIQGENEETIEDFSLEEESVEGEILTQEPQQQLESIATSKPKRTIKKLVRFIETVACAASIVADGVPTTYKDAVQSSEEDK
ncbi:uncharacterized protein [Nicotiana tomentosiformis]|uniref:uncharacterized protein n=1 Tax=Nicotiana tomentosiformis TaxID=4098 RepID=UPI00388C3884